MRPGIFTSSKWQLPLPSFFQQDLIFTIRKRFPSMGAISALADVSPYIQPIAARLVCWPRGLTHQPTLPLGPDGALYISAGQGTPGRPIPGPDGPTTIVGAILRITDYE